MPVPARATSPAPPLAFVIAWNAFTAVHASVMLQGAWGTGAMAFLVPFYLLFFGAGLWMARAWWRGHRLRRQFGAPTLGALPPVAPGHPLALAVAFDRPWTSGAELAGQLRWVTVTRKGHSGDTLAEAPVHGSLVPGATGATWQGRATVPPPPANGGPLRLELVLQPPGSAPGSGWRFELPLQAAPGADIELTAADARQADQVLRWIMMALLAIGSWLAWSHVAGGGRTLFPLGFAGAFLVAGWIVQDLRESLVAAIGTGRVPRPVLFERLQPFARRARGRLQILAALMVLAFFLDATGLLGPGLPGR